MPGGPVPFRAAFLNLQTQQKSAQLAADAPATEEILTIEQPSDALEAQATAKETLDVSAREFEPEAGRITARASLLEPLAAVCALGKPLLFMRAAWRRHIAATPPAIAEPHVSGNKAAMENDMLLRDASGEVFIERSFEEEVATLLRASQRPELQLPQAAGDAATAALPESAHVEAAEKVQCLSDRGEEPPVTRGARRETPSTQEIIVAAVGSSIERMAPLTRLPLRSQAAEISWPAACDARLAGTSQSRADRHYLLEALIREIGSVASSVIESAYLQEDANGRALALRIFTRHFAADGRNSFVNALHSGSDEERSIAIDGLATLRARDALTAGFNDRLDALAAKAALAYVGTLVRDDYRVQLAPYVDEARIESILKLLAGIVE